jgi:hypothetical protein
MGSVGCESNQENEMSECEMYRGFRISKNFRSIHGTGARLAHARGVNLFAGPQKQGWFTSAKHAKAHVDFMYANEATLSPIGQMALKFAAQALA